MPRSASGSAASARAAARAAEDRRTAARRALEEHWAVSALPIADRERARALARRAWRRGTPRLAESWPPHDRTLIDRVSTAYEIAALEHVAAVAASTRELRRLGVLPPAGAVRGDAPLSIVAPDALRNGAYARLGEALDGVRGAADTTFAFARVLPMPWNAGQLPHVLRVLAIGAVAGDATMLAQWVRAARAARGGGAAGEQLAFDDRWDSHLRDAITALWLELGPAFLGVQELDAAVVEQAFETIARLREARLVREAELLVALPESVVPRTRAELHVLYGVLDATAQLVAWGRRGVVALGVPAARHALEGSVVLTAGDRSLDTALHWLEFAIALPPLVAGLHVDGHEASRAAVAAPTSAHGADSALGDGGRGPRVGRGRHGD